MIDDVFIESTIKKGKAAREKVIQEFSDLSSLQFNWKPSPARWSIAQCLEHLVISDSAYFSAFEKISLGTHRMNAWEKYSPLSSFFGRTLKQQLQEHAKKKIVTSKKLTPASSDKSLAFVNVYLKNLDTFLNLISSCRHIDLDKTIIMSPVFGFLTYSLRDAFQFLLQHEHRHINQAMNVRLDVNFPKNQSTFLNPAI